jgi:hypothetical protein
MRITPATSGTYDPAQPSDDMMIPTRQRPAMHLHHSPELGMARTKAMGGFCLKEFAQPPYRRLPWHEHHDASICFVVSGAYAERMRAQDHECPPHSMVFKPAGERHADEFGREGGTCLLIEVGPERLRTLEPVSGVTASEAAEPIRWSWRSMGRAGGISRACRSGSTTPDRASGASIS